MTALCPRGDSDKLAKGPGTGAFISVPEAAQALRNVGLLPSGLHARSLSQFSHPGGYTAVTASAASSFPGSVLETCSLPAGMWLERARAECGFLVLL